MTDNLEASGRSVIEVLSRNFRGEIKKIIENFIQDIRCPGRDSNQNPILHCNSSVPYAM